MIWIGILVTTLVFLVTAALSYACDGDIVTKRVYVLASLGVLTLLSGLWVAPQYNVWQQQLAGKAELARAEQNRQILINEAMAKKESSIHWADAEIERARGAAEANKIVADSLGGPEGYLRWLFIEKLDEIRNGQIIYLPTEAGVPILEAARLSDSDVPQDR